jgi:hypothetical protein
MHSETIAVFIPILGIVAGIVAIMTKHQQRMAEILHGSPQNQSNNEINHLRNEVAELKHLVHQQMIALDAYSGHTRPPAENPLQKRLEQI